MSGQTPHQQSNRMGWNRGPPSPIHYRPPSPWAPSPPPILPGPRRSINSPGVGLNVASPVSSPINTTSRSQPMSPVPTGNTSGLRGTRGINVTHPRPRWPGPQNTVQPHSTVSPSPPTVGGAFGPRPFRPMHSYSPGPTSSFQLSPTPSPVVGPPSNDYLYSAPYENASTKYEYIGVPLEPPQPKSYIIYDDEEEQGPSTAEIIANQSQDYIDEKLAEYQMTILQLQEEQERVQKKTFVNWINSYLSKRIPPLRIEDLIHDLRDGTKLLALLEVLSGEKLPVEKGRVLRRPHFLSNANTALQFLANKKIKLVNINPADLVDGRPPVVLGLIWTIILYFQIEENSKALQYLSQGISGSISSLESLSQPSTDVKAEKWKQGARKTLLQWVTNALPKDAGIEVRDFGASWRDGVAFLALIDAIKANLINLAEMKKSSNRARLETAFDVAEAKLGIAKLLDAEDVDVEKPDEKSIMTYVAQFLHKYPEPKGTGSEGASSIREECDQIFEWLQEKVMFYQPMCINNSFPTDFGEYLLARAEMDTKIPTFNKLKNLVESQANFCPVSSVRWQQIQDFWKQHNLQLFAWLWLLDSELPAEFGVVGKWLMEAEKMLMDDQIPITMNEETASIISTKLEEHKLFFADLPKIIKLFENSKQLPSAHTIPLEQLANMERRLLETGLKSSERRIRLKFLEHKCCLIAFLNLVENKLRIWSGKYGTDEQVLQVLEQYKNFVSKNKIFQEFNKALDDMQQVVEEYKRDGNISLKDSKEIDKFMEETAERWKRVSLELRCCQNTLEEVSACWKKWNSLSTDIEDWLKLAESKVNATEDDRLDFFQNISKWKEKFERLSESVDYLVASCEDHVAIQLKDKFTKITARWEKLFLNTKQYMHASDIIRSRREYQNGLEKLTKWLYRSEEILDNAPLIVSEHLRKCGEELQKLSSEIDEYEELFKATSKIFQNLIQDLSRDDVDKMMKALKATKESLVRVRAQIPIKLHLFHQLLIQQESLETGQKEIHHWLDEAENLLGSLTLSGGKDRIEEQLSRHKVFFSKTLYYKSMMESKNKVFQTLLTSVETYKNIDTMGVSQKMQQLNDRFEYVSKHADQWEVRLHEVSKRWSAFRESERVVSEWLSQAESLFSDQRVETKHSIETQKMFFECVHEKWMNDLVQTAQDLLKNLTTDEQTPIVHTVEKLQEKWREALTKAPLHLTSLEFKLNENNFFQYIKEIDREIHLEQQALNRNDDVDAILLRNNEFFKNQGIVLRIEKILETMKKIAGTYCQNNPSDTSLLEAHNNAEKKWIATSAKIENIRRTLQQIPAQWNVYHDKFLDMVSWMDMVDKSLKKVANEVNSMEEFEKEKIVFQKICHEADNKREDMKWLVKTLDSLLSYASEEEAKHEQKKLEELIARYKNLIPTIEVTMIKTEVYSKCYTYRREVHEVVSLLKKVVDQTINAPQPESLEKVNKMILEQQYAIGQLDHQRTHIMSMLQRGRDLSKDIHAPAFVNDEVKTLESGWNEAYSETVDKLRALKSTQIVWNDFVERKNEIVSLLANAEMELRSITPLQTDPKNVSSDLKAKQDLNLQLYQASKEMIPKLHELRAELSLLTAMEKRPILEKEVTEIEKMFFNTVEHVKDRVGYLEDYSAKWNTYKARLSELQEWANKVAPKMIESLQSQELTPEERAQKTNSFQVILQEKMKYLDTLGSDAADLAPKEGNIAEAKRLKAEIYKLKETLTFINRNMDHQAHAVKEDLLNWQKYQAEIKDIRPIIENFEVKSNAIFSKPVTLQEALQLQHQAHVFEKDCEKNLSRLQQIALISSQMLCKTNAPDEIDSMQSRWLLVQESSRQNIHKINKIVLSWQNFDAEAKKLDLWIENCDKNISSKSYLSQTPHIEKLETELVKLKSFNNEISEQQAKLITLAQCADQIGLGIAQEGAIALKGRINTLKGSISKLSEATRARINEVSDAIMARQDFNAKMANFDNWMECLRTQISQIDEVSPERVEISLNVIHALMQEHSDKNQFLGGIYNEIKNISVSATPEESLALNDSYTTLVDTYQVLEDNLHQKKTTLEKWNELLGWKNETDDHINHMKYQLETTGKLEAEQLAALSEEIDDISKSLIYWKTQAKYIDDTPAVQLRDSLTRKPLIAAHVVNDLENKLENLKLKYQNQKSLTDQMENRKQKFHELENNFTKGLYENRLEFNNLIRKSPNYANIDQIISDLVALNDVMHKQALVRDKLRDEGSILMNEDITNMPAIQESLLSLDKNWEHLQQEISDRINKYTALSQALKEFSGAKEKFEKEFRKTSDMFSTISSEPKDEIELAHATEKTRRTLEQVKKSKGCIEDLERKFNNLVKFYDAIGEVLPNEINLEIESAKEIFHNTQEKILKTAHLYETEAVIWRQIEDAKCELLPWLAETNQGLCDAADNTIEIELGPMRLNKYTIELPSYISLKHDIAEKAGQLAKIKGGVEIPVLKSLNDILTQQFEELEENAHRLNTITTTFNEQERELQIAVKASGENVSKLRENLIKCDDMSGDNMKIIERLLTCRKLKAELNCVGEDINNLHIRVDEMKGTYPTFSESIVPKEFYNVQKRYSHVLTHALKIESTLMQFLKKFHTDKVGILQRMLATQKEKIAWCSPETSSDKYNLDVKKSALQDAMDGLAECKLKQADIVNSMHMLEKVDSPENFSILQKEVEGIDTDMQVLTGSLDNVKVILDDNVALWSQYETLNEHMMSWLREIEGKVKLETSSQTDLEDCDNKLHELVAMANQIKEQKSTMEELERVSILLTEKNPEARIGHLVNHSSTRYQTVAKSLAFLMDRVDNVKKSFADFINKVRECSEWLNDTKIEFNELARMGSPGSSSATAQQLHIIKAFVKTFIHGQEKLNDAVIIGENLYPLVTPHNRDRIRNELRKLRDNFDFLRDESNALLQQVEGVLIQKTSIEESHAQVSHWLDELKEKVGDEVELYPNLATKKAALQTYKSHLQQINLHRNALKQLQEKASNLADGDAERLTEESIIEYEKLANIIADRIKLFNNHVLNHEVYDQILEKALDWLSTIKTESIDILNETTFEKEGAEDKLIIVENLIRQKSEGDKIFEACEKQLQVVLKQTHPSGHPVLHKWFEEPKKAWNEFMSLCEDSLVKLKALCTKWDEFENVIDSIDTWMKNIESVVKDQALKSTVEMKELHLKKLKEMMEEIKDKSPAIQDLMEQGREIDGETDINLKLSRLNTRFQTLKNLCKEAVSKYEIYVKEHIAFNNDYEIFKSDLNARINDLAENNEIVGDLSILQDRQNKIREMSDKRISDSTLLEVLIDRGEKLYGHTSPEGREIIRHQLRTVRTMWDNYTDDLNSASQKLDHCLLQFSEFTLTQEQLTKWLKDIEKAMHNHTELKTTLQEKRAQLQNHKLMHQEILAHSTLVDNVCDKAQNLVEQTKDTSLNIYLHSIKDLFQNIVCKSEDLLKNLENSVQAHMNLNSKIASAKTWISGEKEKLLDCDDFFGEKSDVKRKITSLGNLKENKSIGTNIMDDVIKHLDLLRKSTSTKGIEAIEKEISEFEEDMKNHFNDVEGMELKQNDALKQWNAFEKNLEELTKWCRSAESVFRDQQLQPGIKEKLLQLEKYKEEREKILKKEKEIDTFADNAHTLLNNSGADRLKTLISQITNRYQLLQVLSKEVVNRWHTLVDDHQNYIDKLKEVELWLQPIESQLEGFLKEENVLNQNVLQLLLSKRDPAERLLSSLNSLGEKILPDTSTSGREKTRQELRNVRDRWDGLDEGIKSLQKRQEAHSIQWASYQDSLNQTIAWLDSVEKLLQHECSSTWTSSQEIRSKLFKYKGASQDISSHKRIIEAIHEKANVLIESGINTPEKIQATMADISKRYEQVFELCAKLLLQLEEAFEVYQTFGDLQKLQQDYQKSLWDRLTGFSDYSGNKLCLQARLAKINEIQETLPDGKEKLRKMEDHIEKNAIILPARSKDGMARDLVNLNVDYEKFAAALCDVKSGLENRIQQWTDHERDLDRLLAWLDESENSLKNYAQKSLLEEKQEQLSKFQELICNLRQQELLFEQMKDESSELLQNSGEARILVNIQQITSRLQSVQAAAKEIVKNCEQAVHDHSQYDDKFKQCHDWIVAAQAKYVQCLNMASNGSKEDLLKKQHNIKELKSEQNNAIHLMNNTVEMGEKCYPTTATEGREIIRKQLQDLHQLFEQYIDNITELSSATQTEISKWSGFDELAEKLYTWLHSLDNLLQEEMELRTTLDEKRAKLQNYRDILLEINNATAELATLNDVADNLTEKTDDNIKKLADIAQHFEILYKRAQKFVERYEGIVSDHQLYCKAVMDTQEFIEATNNTVDLWGDLDLEQMSLHTNLDRLKTLKESLADEFPRIDQVRALGEKVIPGTIDTGKINIQSQIDNTQQEWEGLLSNISSVITAIENRLQQWSEYESLRDQCLLWIRETDSSLHAVDLKANVNEKQEQFEILKKLQGEIRAKELEVDNVTEKAQQLYKSPSTAVRGSHASELVFKYQQITHRVKELTHRWQNYVANHQDFETNVNEFSQWIDDMREKLNYCSDSTSMSQRDIEGKLAAIQDLILMKDEGGLKIQSLVESAQIVLANTAPCGHEHINKTLSNIQEEWSNLVLKMVEVKSNLDESMNQWSGYLEQIQNIKKTVDWLENILNELSEYQTTMPEKRAQLDRVRNVEEKVRLEKIDVDTLKLLNEEMMAGGQQSQAAYQAQQILNKFDDLANKTKKLLNEREEEYRAHKLYKQAYDDLVSWTSRAREKIPYLQQSSLSDKLAIESAVSSMDALLNKQAQGELLLEHLTHTGKVVLASTSQQGQEIIRNDIRALRESFESLFREIATQKEQLEITLFQWRDYKDEYERLLEWLQQIDIIVKNHKINLLPTVSEKMKQVSDMKSLMEKLERGKEDIDRFNKSATGLLSSHLDTYINNQLRHLNSMYQVQVNLAKDVLKKVETNLEQHEDFEESLNKSNSWIENAKDIIRNCGEASTTSTKEALQNRLAQVQNLMRKREEGQALVHHTINTGEKIIRNTRSDGRDIINNQIRELQNDWDRIVKKMSTCKVNLETSLLQWADYSSSYSQLQQWISEREAKLQQVCEQKVAKSKRGQPGLSSGLSERKANLRQTNNIVQDIVSFEPMIQSVTSKASDLQQAQPATEISTKYESLSKQAKDLYEKQKNTIETHQALIDAGNEFAQWLRNAKERLSKCAEATGDKETLASKTLRLKILESEIPEGQLKLEKALQQGEIACRIAEEEDREIIEEEVALLQEEFDAFVEAVKKAKGYLETGILKWTEYQDQYSDALDWLTKTETLVQSYNKLQNSLEQKKNVLEQFQGHLQTLFDWQKELDRLNVKAQTLLETCSDTRISNAITQLTTKYNALMTLAKEVMRRLELHYQEHHQHYTLYEECQTWIEKTREKLTNCQDIPSSLSEVQIKLNTVKNIRQGFEQGQNKLRYLLELKEKVILNTEANGVTKIQEDTENLRQDFERLLVDINDVRQKLMNRASQLEEIYKLYKVLIDWLNETEPSTSLNDEFFNDLSEKRVALEKCRSIQRDISSHNDIIEKINTRLKEDDHIDPKDFEEGLVRFETIQEVVNKHIENLENQVNNHEKYKQASSEVSDWIRKTKMEVDQCSDSHGEKNQLLEKLDKLKEIDSSMANGFTLLETTVNLSKNVIETSGHEGQDIINQEIKHFKEEWEILQTSVRNATSKLNECLLSWTNFIEKSQGIKNIIDFMDEKFQRIVQSDCKSSDDLKACKELLEEVIGKKESVEELNDLCEILMELSASSHVRDQTVEIQSNYTKLLTNIKYLVSKIEKNFSDHTEFVNLKKEMNAWINTANEVLFSCTEEGGFESIQQQLDLVNVLAARLPEGQHLLGIVQDAYARATNVLSENKQEELRGDMQKLRSDWDEVNLIVKQKLISLKQAQSRWTDYYGNKSKIETQLVELDEQLQVNADSRAELSEMKTLLERYKNIQKDIIQKKIDLENLLGEAVTLGADLDGIHKLIARWEKINNQCATSLKAIEVEISDYSMYHQSLQDAEKWLLQVSFQLMAHNSLFISNREQTQQQISQHEALLEEIQKYQSNIDGLTSLGQGQIERYESTTPSIRHAIQTQLKNINDSYNSLLYTSVQIKNRLLESLSKFQEYEDALDAILRNLSDYEPLIQTELDQPATDLHAAQNQLKCAQNLQNKLLSEKAKLASAIQACEAATASISRPSSPLETAMHSIPERELIVRAKLENLLEQVHSHLGDITATVAELEQQEKQKLEIQDWIKKQNNVISEWSSRPCKLRLEGGKQDLLLMKDLLVTIGDRRSQLMTDMVGSLGDNDMSKLQKDLDILEGDLMEATARKQSGQDTIENYRQSILELQNWFDDLIKQTDLLEKGSGLHCEQKLAAVYKIKNEFKNDGPTRMDDVKTKANNVIEIISNLDGQQVEEQLKSVDRRYNDLVKRIDRKAQLLEATNKGIIGAKNEIDSIQDWVKEKLNEFKNPALIGHKTKSAEARQAQIKSLLKDSEAKQNLAETLEKRIINMQHELEPAELSQLESALRNLAADQKELSNLLLLELERAAEAAKTRKSYESDVDKVKAWLKTKLAELKKVSQHHPLASQGIELELMSNKKYAEEIKSFGENSLNDVIRQGNTILRECPDTEKASFQSLLNEINEDYNTLKDEIGKRIKYVHDLLQDRKTFEKDIDNLNEWLNEIEVNLSVEIYVSSLPVLEEQLSKYKSLCEDCQNKNKFLCEISDHAKSIAFTISNADKLKLNENMKTLKERYLKLSQALSNRCKALEEHIRKHKEAKNKLSDCILFLNSIQHSLKELNKPVGSRIEDVQELLKAYEIILGKLKSNKMDMSNLQTENVPELQSIIIQQDDMIKLIEDQLMHLKQLLLLREQFIALINEIIAFILKYTEIVNEIEKVPSSIEEKIADCDKIIGKIQECEALLATATDKGHKIASEGTIADRNSITEQLQSLKNQLQGLRKVVESQKQKHQLTLDEHKKLVADLSECLDELHKNEGQVKSRPLLDRDPDSVEREIQKHVALADDLKTSLEHLKELCDVGDSKVGLPSLISEMISEARSLLSTLPCELEDRAIYLKSNKQSRIDYMNFVAQFNSWIHEAEIRLQNGQHGVDYEHIDKDIEDQRNFFESDGFVKDLVSRKIQEAADKIWPSLHHIEQDELSRELKHYSEALQKLLSKARDTQARLEEQAEKWKQYGQRYIKVKAYVQRIDVSDEAVSNLTELHSNIQKTTRAISNAQALNADIDLLNQEAQNLIRQADSDNRQRIEAENLLLNKDWEEFVIGLQNRHEVLTSLAEAWGTFENKLHIFEKHLIRLEEKCGNVDLVVKSRRQLEETKDALQEIIGESEDLKASFKEIEVLSEPIITFVQKAHTSSPEAIQIKINKLAEKHKRLNEILHDKETEANKLLEQIETIFRKISETQDKLNYLLEEINETYVYNENYSEIENAITAISSKVKNVIKEGEEIVRKARENYITEQNLLPSDVAQEITALELLSERVTSAMDRKESEFKKAKTIRTEYVAGVDEIQKWIHKVESEVEERTLEPLQLKDVLHCINIEFTNIRDKLHNVKQNGMAIIENSRNSQEKELVQKTVDQLTQQIEHIGALLDMKKQQVGDSLDAWTRFMNLYQIVMAWVSDKKVFLSESLTLRTLPESRQKLNDYSLAVKTIKPIVKNLSEMDKELELISQITIVGELKNKLQEAEEAKVEVEAVLLQRNALLQEVTEEWEQCEKKIRDIRAWLDKTKSNLESLQQKRKPLRDQLGYCEKVIAEINVQKSKLALSIEKLEVHFRSGIGGDARLSENVDELLKILEELSVIVRSRIRELEESINQIETYQEQMQSLRQKIVQEEQQLRLLLTPMSNSPDFDKILADQQVCREHIKDLQSKINARNERIRMLISRGEPDGTMLDF